MKKTFRILHVADVHLGLKLYGFDQRILDHAAALLQVAKIAINEKVDLVVDAGDTYDSPEPDPISVKTDEQFAYDLHAAGIPLIRVVGNHNVHRLSSKFNFATWADMRHIGRPISFPGLPPLLSLYPNRAGDMSITLAAADWMPADQIEEFLGRFPRDHKLDLLVMHQSCEGFIPAVATTEIQLKMLTDVAKVVALGDLHVAKTIDINSNCRVTYPGPTEYTERGEDLEKSVNIITFTEGNERADIQRVPLKTRPVIVGLVLSSTDLDILRAQIEETAETRDKPLVIIPYSRELSREVKKFKDEILAAGLSTMVRLSPEASVEKNLSRIPGNAGSSDVEDLLRAEIPDSKLHPTAIALWQNPKNSDQILAALRERIEAEFTQPVPAPTPL